ncbi:MAG: Fe-S cluster assembly ATPase SufC [Candidatus Sungiibacteriota bacterium]
MPLLAIDNLYAEIEGKKILFGASLAVGQGEVHFLMGPNGSGKTTLAGAIMGSPHIKVTGGGIIFDGKEIMAQPPEERAKMGLYLWFQHPAEVAGVGLMDFLRSAVAARGGVLVSQEKFHGELVALAEKLHMPTALLDRNLNEGFSGGEKKRSELLQFCVLKPRLAILDECDSGLDVDGLRAAAAALDEFRRGGGSLLVITHYGALREYLRPDKVHIMMQGVIAQSGGEELITAVEKNGFAQFDLRSPTS